MIDTKYLRGSDGTGSAVLAHISVSRLVGATTLKVDNVDNWPPFFIATSGKLNPAGYIIESTKKEFRGHLQGVDIIIDGFEPGFTDEGNTTDQVVILKQTTGWANRAQDALEELQGVVQTDLPRQFSETSADFVVSGGIWSLISGRDATMTALVAYIKGYRNTIAAVATRTFTASKDTYVDVLRNTTTGAFSLVYTEVALGATSPALAANSLRLAKVITSGSAITSVQQNGVDAVTNNGRVNYFRNTSPNAAPIFVFQNNGSASGSFWYRDQNGIKEMWGLSGNNSVTTTPQTRGLDTPAGFFNSIISANVGVFQVGAQQAQYAILQGFGASGGTLTQWANSNGTQVASLYVRGY